MADVFKDHFSSVAGKYAAFRPDYPRELFQWLASVAPARTRVWDCATGNGQAAASLAEFFEEVIATDASAEQIANASRHSKVRYSVAQAESSGLAPESVELVTVAQAAHWFELDGFYNEVRRVLRPDGVVALWCYGVFEFENSRIQELLDDFYHNVVGPFWPAERRYVEEHYRTLRFPFVEVSGPQFLIQAEFTFERLLGYLRTWSATQRFVKSNGFDPVARFGRSLEEFWPTDGALPKIKWPIDLRTGRPG